MTTPGNRTSEAHPDAGSTQIEYDALNRPFRWTDPLSHVRSVEYDPNNNVTTRTDGLIHSRTYSYDKLDRPKTEVLPRARSMAGAPAARPRPPRRSAVAHRVLGGELERNRRSDLQVAQPLPGIGGDSDLDQAQGAGEHIDISYETAHTRTSLPTPWREARKARQLNASRAAQVHSRSTWFATRRTEGRSPGLL
jgi:YD repeat-containing protein